MLQLAAKKEKKAAYYAEKKERREVRRAIKKAKKAARKNKGGDLAPDAEEKTDEDGKDAVAFWSGSGDGPTLTANDDAGASGGTCAYILIVHAQLLVYSVLRQLSL